MNAKSPVRPGVLSGIRVLDFTWKTVGPWAPRLLTHYGAEVIHVERAGGYDDHRYNATPSIVSDEPQAAQLPGTKKVYADPQFNTLRDEPAAAAQVPGEKKLYAAPYFNTLHNGKLAISLNTKHPEGLKIVERLIGVCDALVENFSAEVLPSWGLTWERIHEINPRLVYMSSSGFGHTGEWKGYRSFGPTAQAQSGLSLASGLPGKPPAGWGFSYLDVMGGWMGGLALIQGLLKAKKTGKGFYIDYSVTEGAMSMIGTYMLDYQVNGRRTRRPDFPPGNRSIFPARGAAQHVPLRGQGPQRAELVGLHRVRDAAAVRVALPRSWASRVSRSIPSSRPTRRAWLTRTSSMRSSAAGRARGDATTSCRSARRPASSPPWSRARRTGSSTIPSFTTARCTRSSTIPRSATLPTKGIR